MDYAVMQYATNEIFCHDTNRIFCYATNGILCYATKESSVMQLIE